ncbi:MAG: Rossman fold protein, TIGR00730 family [Planctomycetes bacterium RBG_13_60_9]|nr:MAG: Rossman fold protein, TIGR00730 family [Planctomycetes bacterium RBG_13_60_9]
MILRRICVYCGSGVGGQDGYADAARALGKALVERGIGLVFGGGRIGMMGVLAETVLQGGGEAIGVIPKDLMDKGLGLATVTSLRVVETMHMRKALMAELADAFLALPGGFGTAEEFFEALTWAQLGLHAKPCGLLNVKGYFDHLIRFVDHAVHEQFIDPACRALLLVDDAPDAMLTRLVAWEPPPMAEKAAWAKRLVQGEREVVR